MENLWNLNGIVEDVASDQPYELLKSQLVYFNTNFSNKNLNAELERDRYDYNGYQLSTSFYIVAPRLDDYNYLIFRMYSSIVEEFPVCLESILFDDYNLNSDCGPDGSLRICNTIDELRDNLKLILSSAKTTKVISSMIAKSKL